MPPVPNQLQPPAGPSSDGRPRALTDAKAGEPVVELVEPLFKDGTSGLSVDKVRVVREQLQQAISTNKKRGHDLLIENFPTVSSHIRLGTELRGNLSTLQATLEGLERDIDASDPEVSFLPPVLGQLDRHFAAVQNKARAEAHIKALRALKSQTERIKKLEEAIWAGRGADDWVVEALSGNEGYQMEEGQEYLRDTKTSKLAQERIQLFRSMVVEQVTDAYSKAVSFEGSPAGVTIKVQPRTTLQQPRIPRYTQALSSAKASVPPPYSLSRVYTVLSSFSALTSTTASLRTKLLKDVIPPISTGSWKINIDRNDNSSTLRLEKLDSRPEASLVLRDISALLTFLDMTIFPTSVPPIVHRDEFLADIHCSIFRSILDNVLLTSMPAALSAIPPWLAIVQETLDIEEKHANESSKSIIKPFFEDQAGKAWADQRRRRVVEEVRKLIVGGWGGWEAREAEREKAVVMVVEVEVEDEPAAEQEKMDVDDGFGWGFEDEKKEKAQPTKPTEPIAAAGDVEEEGWGFDDTPGAGPSSPRPNPLDINGSDAQAGGETQEDGWDFDDPTPIAKPASPPKPVLAKPAKEAKRLGKKVAKVKAVVEDDPWGSGSESVSSSVPPQNGQSSDLQPEEAQNEGWGWDEPAPTTSAPASQGALLQSQPIAPAATKAKRKELKEEKRMIKETFLVSRACDKLVDMAERALREAEELRKTSLSSASFGVSSPILLAAATDVFDLHRSLLPSHYAPQLRDVPTLSMQVHNDALHLATRVEELHRSYPAWNNAEDIIFRLRGLADHAFETQVASQRDALFESINEAEGFAVGTDIGLRRAERAIAGVVHNIETMSKILRVVLPTTTYLTVLGYLLDEAVSRITTDILELNDITETESERLNDLLKHIRPLEEIFVVEPGQPSTVVAHVPHWLKFCYISELLQANLVDILYLFDSGALIDFSTQELVSLLRALFADSERRDNAIERIEQGVPTAAA